VIPTHSNHTAGYEGATKQILQRATDRIRHVWEITRKIFVQLTAKGKSQLGGTVLSSKQEVEAETYRLYYELAANLSVVPVSELNDPLLRRLVQRMAKLQLQGCGQRTTSRPRTFCGRYTVLSAGRWSVPMMTARPLGNWPWFHRL